MSAYASARRSATSGPKRRHTSALQYASSDHRAPSPAALQSTTPLIRPRCQRTLPGWKSPCVKMRSEESKDRRAVTARTAAAVRGSCSPAGGGHVSIGGGGGGGPPAPPPPPFLHMG